jgi:hypothetical protein
MPICFLSFILIFLLALSNYAHAQFEAVYVTMESGEEIPLTELPWFRHAYFIWGVAPQKFHADDGDWIVYAPPKFCPSTYYFWVLWGQGENQSKKIENEKERSKSNCSDTQVGKWLSDLPEIKQMCKCKLILQTTNVLDKNNKKIKWKSHDDSILKNENLTLRFDLIDKKLQWHKITNTPGGICDMTLYYLLYSENIIANIIDLNMPMKYPGTDIDIIFDHNVCDSYGFNGERTFNKNIIKIIRKIENRFYFQLADKQQQYIQTMSIHFQGNAKRLLSSFSLNR